MTADTPTVTADALDTALGTAAGSLAADEQRLAVAVFRLLSAGTATARCRGHLMVLGGAAGGQVLGSGPGSPPWMRRWSRPR